MSQRYVDCMSLADGHRQIDRRDGTREREIYPVTARLGRCTYVRPLVITRVWVYCQGLCLADDCARIAESERSCCRCGSRALPRLPLLRFCRRLLSWCYRAQEPHLQQLLSDSAIRAQSSARHNPCQYTHTRVFTSGLTYVHGPSLAITRYISLCLVPSRPICICPSAKLMQSTYL